MFPTKATSKRKVMNVKNRLFSAGKCKKNTLNEGEIDSFLSEEFVKISFRMEIGEKVRVEYSTFGTNEDLYNQMTLGSCFPFTIENWMHWRT